METVCILLSTYNGERFLNDQLHSLLNQKGVNTYLIIRDDGSTDSTISIIKEWKLCYPNWIFYEEGTNLGSTKSFSVLLGTALKKFPNVQYFSFCDQDDIWLENKLAVAIEHLTKSKDSVPALYFSNLEVVDVTLNKIELFWRKNEVQVSKPGSLVQNFASGCTEVFNKAAAVTYIRHVTAEVSFHDYFMYQMCLFLGEVVYDDTPHILYRQHGNNQVGKKRSILRYIQFLRKPLAKTKCLESNRIFLESFKSQLCLDDIFIFSKLLNYKDNSFSKLSLFVDNKIRFTNLKSNILLKVRILLGLL